MLIQIGICREEQKEGVFLLHKNNIVTLTFTYLSKTQQKHLHLRKLGYIVLKTGFPYFKQALQIHHTFKSNGFQTLVLQHVSVPVPA